MWGWSSAMRRRHGDSCGLLERLVKRPVSVCIVLCSASLRPGFRSDSCLGRFYRNCVGVEWVANGAVNFDLGFLIGGHGRDECGLGCGEVAAGGEGLEVGARA